MNRRKLDFMKRPIAAFFLALFLVGSLLFVPRHTLANSLDVQDQINSAIEAYSDQLLLPRYQDFQLQIRPIDARMKLEHCAQPLTVNHRPPGRISGRLTMKVSCSAPSNWKIHVPVVVKAFDDVVIAKHPIPKGSHLTAADVRLERKDISLLHSGYYRNLSQVVGQVSKRPIRQNFVINSASLQPAMMVDRGEKVVILAEGNGLSIRTTGIAMQQGGHGDLIQVKNSKTDKVVEGRIIGPGQIKVSL